MSYRIKVLIVEDDNALAQMCAKLIRRRGHSAVIACSSQDALAIVRMVGDIDVVISDIKMPAMDGIQLMSHLHAIDAELPIILMTGYTSILGSNPAKALGAADYLVKPFDSEALLGSVERAFRMKHPQAAVE